MSNLHDNNKRLTPDTFDESTRHKKHFIAVSAYDLGSEILGSNESRESEVVSGLHSQLTLPDDPGGLSPYSFAQNYGSTVQTPSGLKDDTTSFHDPFTLSNDEVFIGHICYGVVSYSNSPIHNVAEQSQLVVDMSSNLDTSQKDQCLRLELEGFGEMVKATYQNSGKFAGLIRLPAIGQLLDDIAVQLTTTLIASSPSSANSAKTSKKKITEKSLESIVRIVISGAREDRSRVGKLCSDAQLFLQHPFMEECGEMEYSNPHYLLRPGAKMPKLQSSPAFSSSQATVSNSLNEVNKSRIMRIFDLNCGDISSSYQEYLISSRLLSVLKR